MELSFEGHFLDSDKEKEVTKEHLQPRYISHFLDSDQEKAFAEMICIVDCLNRIADKIDQQDYAGALIHIENFRRSVAELKRLNDRKKKFDQLRDILQEVLKDGDHNG